MVKNNTSLFGKDADSNVTVTLKYVQHAASTWW